MSVALMAIADARLASAIRAAPNTNLLHSRSDIPQLSGDIQAGTSVLLTAVYGGRQADFSWCDPSVTTVCDQLRRLAQARLGTA